MELNHFAIVKTCGGCSNIENVACRIWSQPWAKQRLTGGCPSQTNKVKVAAKANGKVRVGQQKQKKTK